MVKPSDINKDIRSISEKVGVALFSYDDIHNEAIDNEFHYDYKRVIQEVSRLQKTTPEEAEKNLVDKGILRFLPGGEYEVNVGGTTREGGGLNYGDAFFFLSSKDYQTKYHELAHSLQDKYDLFNNEKIDLLYDKSEKSLRSDENKEDKLLDKENYKRYLNEMHSEVFGYGALLLRAESKRDFLKQALNAYRSGVSRNAEGFFSFGKTEYGSDGQNNSKFYVTKSVMKPMIKAIWKIRKEGRKAEFFDENGVLNDEKFAKLCEDVVMKNAYSPRTLKSFFEYKIGDTHSDEEKGWRRDTIESIVATPIVMTRLFEKGEKEALKSIYKHKRLVAEENKKLRNFVAKENNCKDPELQALKEYERLKVKLLLIDKELPKNDVGEYISSKFPLIVENRMTDSFIRTSADLLSENTKDKVLIERELKEVRKIIQKNKYNSYFKKIMDNRTSEYDLKNMLKDKLKNPDKEVTAGLEYSEKNYGLATYPLHRQINKVQNFAKEYQLPLKTKETILEMMVRNPSCLDSADFRRDLISEKSFSNDFFGRKKKKYKKEFNKLLDEVGTSYYSNNGNPVYQELLTEMAKYSVKEYADKIASMEKQERESIKNKQSIVFASQSTSMNNFEKKMAENKQFAGIASSLQVNNKNLNTSSKPLTPEEEVQRELESLGVDKKSYLMLTPKDKELRIGYGNEQGSSIAGYFDKQEEAAKMGAFKLMGSNNGMTAVYFAKQNIYVVAPSYDLRKAMKSSDGCVDVGYGVMFSNGEKFTNNEFMNNKMKEVKDYVKEAEEIKKRELEYDSVTALPETRSVSGRVASEQTQSNEAIFDKSKSEDVVKKDNAQNSQINNFEKVQSSDKSLSSDKTEKVYAMGKKEKGRFFHNLRLGINTILMRKTEKVSQKEIQVKNQRQQDKNSNINSQITNKIVTNNYGR